MKKSVIITSVVIVAAAAALILPRALRPDPVVEAVALPIVEVEMPFTGSIELSRNLVGKVEPSDVVYVYPKAAGQITDVYVKAGDMVKEGQAICKIDTKQVESARLSLDSAKMQLDDARTNLGRQRVLYEAGDISPAAFEQAQTAVTGAQIQYDGAKLNYDNQIEFSNMTAPISGKVEIFDVEVHDVVSAQVMICVISGEGSKAVTFSVPEKIVSQMQKGDTITLEKNGTEYQGIITEISSMIDANTGLFKVKSSVESGDALATGSMVKLYVTSDRADDVMCLPVDSIYYSGGNSFVYTYDNGIVHKVPVEAGIYDAEKVEIISGITSTDQIITTWSSELFEGSKVQAAGEAAVETEAIPTEPKAE